MRNENCHVFSFKISAKFMAYTLGIISPHTEKLAVCSLITSKTGKQLVEQLIQYVVKHFISYFYANNPVYKHLHSQDMISKDKQNYETRSAS